MSQFALRSPSDKVDGLVHFGRMLDKIRAHARGELPAEYQPNLGKGFDGSCVEFLGVDYDDIVAQVKQDQSDEQVLEWCRRNGKQRTASEVQIWNEWMRKRGWRDEITPTLERRKRESAFAGRDEIQTMFDYIDADEGRPLSSMAE